VLTIRIQAWENLKAGRDSGNEFTIQIVNVYAVYTIFRKYSSSLCDDRDEDLRRTAGDALKADIEARARTQR
jgi:hypothetical protein